MAASKTEVRSISTVLRVRFQCSKQKEYTSQPMRLRSWLLFIFLVVPGVFCFFFCMYFALRDWAELRKAYDAFARLAGTSCNLSLLFVAEARQNIHRINLFADVVWALLGAIVAAIGLHGLCVNYQSYK